MTWLFAGSEAEDFRIGSLSNYSISNSSSYRDSDFSKYATRPGSGSAINADFVANTEVWLHAHIAMSGVYSNPFLYLLNSETGTARISVEEHTATINGFRVGYWNGSGFTYLTKVPNNDNTQYEIDLHVKLHATDGVIEFYVDGALVSSFYGDTSGIATSFNGAQFIDLSGKPYVSQVIVGDSARSTVGLRLLTLQPSASGNANDWTNGTAVSNINDNSQSTYISSDTAGQVSQYSCSQAPSGSYDVLSVFVRACAKKGADGIQNMQLGVRSNGADTFSPSLSDLATSFGPVSYNWDTNPNNGGADWTLSDINSLQAGVKAVA